MYIVCILYIRAVGEIGVKPDTLTLVIKCFHVELKTDNPFYTLSHVVTIKKKHMILRKQFSTILNSRFSRII